MKVKTADLIGPALDWAVAECDGVPIERKQYSDPDDWDWYYNGVTYYPSQDWAIAGPIIEREEIFLAKSILGGWTGSIYVKAKDYNCIMHAAPTPLIAAMRCYVASKLGDEIEVPDELFSFA